MPSFWDRLRGKRQAKDVDSLELFRQVYGTPQSWSGRSVTLDSAMQVSTALACGRVIAEGIATLPWKVMQAKGSTIEPAVTHPLYDLLAVAPNPIQTAFEFQETMGLHLAFCGNAYVWVNQAPGIARRNLYLLEPAWVTVKSTWPDAPSYDIRIDNREPFTLTAQDVWHIRGPSWTTYTGLQFLTLARQALGLSMAIEEGQAKLQSQGVSLPGFLSVDGTLTGEQQTKLRAWIEKEHAGSSNAGRPMILDRASKWVATAMTNTDAQTLDQRKMQVEEVCRFMRVLPIMVGHSDKTATYASSEQMFLAHAIYTLGPWARRLEQSANKVLLTPMDREQGFYTKLNEKALQRMTARDQMEVLTRGVLAGVYTRNEVRAKLDMNPITGLDEPLSPANTFAGNPPEAPDRSGADGAPDTETFP